MSKLLLFIVPALFFSPLFSDVYAPRSGGSSSGGGGSRDLPGDTTRDPNSYYNNQDWPNIKKNNPNRNDTPTQKPLSGNPTSNLPAQDKK